MNTINHKHGYIAGYMFSGTYSAYSHGECLGLSYKTIAGGRCAITRHHRRWLKETNGGRDIAKWLAR